MPMCRRTATGSTSFAVDVLAVVGDRPRLREARDQVVHPVEAADERALAAARRPDDRGDEVLVDVHRDVLDRRLAAVQRIEAVDVEDPLEPLAWRQRLPFGLDAHGGLDRNRHIGILHHREVLSLRRLRVASQRATRLVNEDEDQQHESGGPRARMILGIGATPRARRSRPGTVCSAWCGFQFSSVPTSDDVKRSGAVSPATRATASTVPVTMPPIVCGRTMLSVVRQRATPSARLASRSEFGTRIKHLHRRARDEREHQARERERRRVPALPVSEHEEPVDEDADDDRRNAVQHVEREADDAANGRRGELDQIERDEDARRERHQGRDRDDDERSGEGIRESPCLRSRGSPWPVSS